MTSKDYSSGPVSDESNPAEVAELDDVSSAAQNSKAGQSQPYGTVSGSGSMETSPEYPAGQSFGPADLKEAWEEELKSAPVISFPERSHEKQGYADSTLSHEFTVTAEPDLPCSLATLAKGAWSLILAGYVDSEDVVYISLDNGHKESIAGTPSNVLRQPALYPSRVRVERKSTVEQFLLYLQAHSDRANKIGQYGIQQIRQLGGDAQVACDNRLLFSVDIEPPGISVPPLPKDAPWHNYALGLRCVIRGDWVALTVNWCADLLATVQAKRLLYQVEYAMRQLRSGSRSERLCDVDLFCQQDADAIAKWNATPPWKEEECVHNLMHDACLRQPDLPAVVSTEGQLTYSQLDEYSTNLAAHICKSGLVFQPGEPVAMSFEKSIWTIVAVLAVLKCGGAPTLIDPGLPQDRCNMMLKQIQPAMALCSNGQRHVFEKLPADRVVIFDSALALSLPKGDFRDLSVFTPSTAALIVYTSGSTGVPKGVVLSHRAVCSVVVAAREALGTTSETRLLQFAPYGVGAFYGEMFFTFFSGGRLCVVTDQERAESLPAFIAHHRVNFSFFTPSVGARMPPFAFPSFKTLLVGAERMTDVCVQAWATRVNLIQIYGNTESTVISVIRPGLTGSDSLGSVGRPFVGRIWIVKKDNVNQLASIGEIGEILIEGHHLAQGYLGQPSLTAKVFIKNPPWSTSGPLAHLFTGCARRFYCSGDLAMLNPDGDLELRGRRDFQLKIRGQRVEQGEIEAQIRKYLPGRTVAVEGIELQANSGIVIVAFFTPTKPMPGPASLDTSTDRSMYGALVRDLEPNLASQLPSYMVPSVCLPVTSMPYTHTGKIDRKLLRELAMSLTRQELFSFYDQDVEKVAPSTKTEIALQQLWADALDIPPGIISANDNFFRIGGDSLSAMKVVAKAQETGLALKMKDLLMTPVLMTLATSLSVLGDLHSGPSDGDVEPFGLVGNSELAKREAGVMCGVPEADVVDVHPATALQEGLIVLGQRNPGAYMARFNFDIPEFIDLDRLQVAFDMAFQEIPILRTRLYQSNDGRMHSAVIRADLAWTKAQDWTRYLEDDRAKIMRLGEPLARFACGSGNRCLSITVHHAIYDGWTLRLIFRRVIELYREPTSSAELANFNRFIRYAESVDALAAKEYWRERLHQASPPVFPADEPKYQAASLKQHIDFTKCKDSEILNSTLARCALAIVLARYSESEDVTFGEVRSGRTAPVRGILNTYGPTIATVPVRIRIAEGTTVAQLLMEVQRESFEIGVFEQYGLQNIRLVSDDAKAACALRSVLIVQNAELEAEKESAAMVGCSLEDSDAVQPFNAVSLVLQIFFTDEGYTLDLNYNSNALLPAQAARLLKHFVRILEQLDAVGMASCKIEDLAMAVPEDLADIRGFNDVPLQAVDDCLQNLFERMAQRQPHSAAIAAHDGNLTYEELDYKTSQLAQQLQQKGVSAGDIIPLLFQKSMWAIVSMIAVLKCGAAYCPLDVNHPTERACQIVEDLSAKLVLTSDMTAARAVGLPCSSFQVSPDIFEDAAAASLAPPRFTPDQHAYCLFTSGSSGRPKGVLTSHRAICTSITMHAALGLDPTIRMLQFSAYTFDISVVEIFSTLAHGGCICMPSEIQRLEGVVDAINDWGVNCAILTPTFATLVPPKDVPSMKLLVLGGEPIRKELIQSWAGKVRLVNAYGVTEASVCNMLAEITDPDFSEHCIGRPIGSLSWIVDPKNHDRLVPVGTTGELAIEGPILSDCYLNDPIKTGEAFISDPEFFAALYPERRDSNEQRRIYKTGDLVKQRTNGMIDFVGRKDTQIKLRGLRIELGEIEYQVRRIMGQQALVAAEVIAPAGRPKDPAIALFLGDPPAGSQPVATIAAAAGGEMPHISEKLISMSATLDASLPAYMIPTSYFLIKAMPLLSSGKVDRKTLRAFASQNDIGLPLAALESGGPLSPPDGEKELVLQSLWASVLGVELDRIGKQTSFFRLGGDSILAVRLSALARRESIFLSVASIFSHPKLEDMATVTTPYVNSPLEGHLTATSTLSLKQNTSIMQEASHLTGLDVQSIEDILPTTPLQKGLVSESLHVPGANLVHFVYRLSRGIDMTRLHDAWYDFLHRASATRTRIVNTAKAGLVQVVSKEASEIHRVTSLDIESYKKTVPAFALGQPLFRVAILDSYATTDRAGDKCLLLSAHHSIYDGWSMVNAWRCVQEVYFDLPRSPILGMGDMVMALRQTSDEESLSFWEDYLRDCPGSTFPPLPASGYRPLTDAEFTTTCRFRKPSNTNVTLAALVYASWGHLLSLYEGTTDVSFAVVSSGRDVPLPGIENLVGLAVAVHPVRVQCDNSSTIPSFLESVITNMAKVVPYQHLGLHQIRKTGQSPQSGAPPRTLLSFQSGNASSLGFDSGNLGITSVTATNVGVHACPLVFSCTAEDDSLTLEVAYDSNVIQASEVNLFTTQFSHILNELSAATSDIPSRRLRELSLTSPADVAQIDAWRALAPITKGEEMIHELFREQARIRPHNPAVCSWDCKKELSYAELDKSSDRLAQALLEMGVSCKTVVGFCFNKSWVCMVVIMALLKCGGVWVPLNPGEPKQRLHSKLSRLSGRFCLTDSTNEHLFANAFDKTLTVTKQFIEALPTSPVQLPQVNASDPAYMMFTSGSTGLPKCVIVSHVNLASALPPFAQIRRQGPHTRFLQFSAFTWDACVAEIFCTLISGGCVCIPSEEERMNDLGGTLTSMRVNAADLTPTVTRFLEPSGTPLKSLTIGGEKVPLDVVQSWKHHVELVESYGPVEATVQCAAIPSPRLNSIPGEIGTPVNCFLWLVDPNNRSRLVPVGAVGEICVDGWLVAQYFEDAGDSSSAFIARPDWASTTDDHQPKLYVTGDLGVYLPDGSIRCLGRRDTQLKIDGQRVDLEEISLELRRALPTTDCVCAEIVTLKDRDKPLLVAYFVLPGFQDKSIPLQLLRAPGVQECARRVLAGIEEKLSEVLPAYMVPRFYLPVSEMPRGVSQKTDHMALQALCADFTMDDMVNFTIPTDQPASEPLTSEGLILRRLWSQLLNVKESSISGQQSFASLGGDSVVAVLLVSTVLRAGLTLSVADVFQNQSLNAMASKMTPRNSAPPASSLMKTDDDMQKVRIEVAQKCSILVEDIQDIYPALPVQIRFKKVGRVHSGAGSTLTAFELPPIVDADRLEAAWRLVVRTHAILRTRIVEIGDDRWIQVVVRETDEPLRSARNLYEYHEQELKDPVGEGTPLMRAGFVYGSSPAERSYFCITACHSARDAWSESLLLAALKETYLDPTCAIEEAPFTNFVKYIQDTGDPDDSRIFWQEQFADHRPPPPFGSRPKDTSLARAGIPSAINTILVSEYKMPKRLQPTEFLMSTIISTCWGLALSQMTGAKDLALRVTSDGRSAPVDGIERIAGPTVTCAPLRLVIRPSESAEWHMIQVQKRRHAMMAHEACARDRWHGTSPECGNALEDALTLTITPSGTAMMDLVGVAGPLNMPLRFGLGTNDHNPSVDCVCNDDTTFTWATFDDHLIERDQVTELVARFQHIMAQVRTRPLQTLVSEMDIDARSLAKMSEVMLAMPADGYHTYDVSTRRVVDVREAQYGGVTTNGTAVEVLHAHDLD